MHASAHTVCTHRCAGTTHKWGQYFFQLVSILPATSCISVQNSGQTIPNVQDCLCIPLKVIISQRLAILPIPHLWSLSEPCMCKLESPGMQGSPRGKKIKKKKTKSTEEANEGVWIESGAERNICVLFPQFFFWKQIWLGTFFISDQSPPMSNYLYFSSSYWFFLANHFHKLLSSRFWVRFFVHLVSRKTGHKQHIFFCFFCCVFFCLLPVRCVIFLRFYVVFILPLAKRKKTENKMETLRQKIVFSNLL